MESTLSKSLNPSLSPFLFSLHRHLQTRLFTRRIRCICNDINSTPVRRFKSFGSASPSSFSSSLYGAVPTVRRHLESVSSSSASFASSGGGGGFGGGENGDGGNDGGENGGGDTKSKSIAAGADEAAPLPSEIIILDVGGMTCGGCAASVKRILENQPQVSSASVNLTTETAIVWPVTEAKVNTNWQKQLGEALAKHLTDCGFTSNLRGQEAIEGDITQ